MPWVWMMPLVHAGRHPQSQGGAAGQLFGRASLSAAVRPSQTVAGSSMETFRSEMRATLLLGSGQRRG